jgi:hypothetical protein
MAVSSSHRGRLCGDIQIFENELHRFMFHLASLGLDNNILTETPRLLYTLIPPMLVMQQLACFSVHDVRSNHSFFHRSFLMVFIHFILITAQPKPQDGPCPVSAGTPCRRQRSYPRRYTIASLGGCPLRQQCVCHSPTMSTFLQRVLVWIWHYCGSRETAWRTYGNWDRSFAYTF